MKKKVNEEITVILRERLKNSKSKLNRLKYTLKINN